MEVELVIAINDNQQERHRHSEPIKISIIRQVAMNMEKYAKQTNDLKRLGRAETCRSLGLDEIACVNNKCAGLRRNLPRFVQRKNLQRDQPKRVETHSLQSLDREPISDGMVPER